MSENSLINNIITLNNSKPFYIQLLEMIQEKIKNGTLKPGDMLPSESELCSQFNLSRTTVRLMFSELKKKGVVIRRRGLGTFISEPKLHRKIDNLYSFTNDILQMGKVPSSEVVKFNKADGQKLFGDEPDRPVEPVFEMLRARYADGEPMLLEHTYVPIRLCPDLTKDMLEKGSLYRLLAEKSGVSPYKAIETYETILVNENDARHLKCKSGIPAFLIHRTAFDEKGEVIEYTTSVVPGERTRFVVTLYEDNAQIKRKTGEQYDSKNSE